MVSHEHDTTMDYTQSQNCESAEYCKVLPNDLYEKVCESLGMPILNVVYEKVETAKACYERRHVKQALLSKRKTLNIDRDKDSDTEVEIELSHKDQDQNIHWKLLQKPEREMITWESHYLEPEREDQKSLVKKADDLTDKICQEFCHYMKQLGGEDQSELFTPVAIKELFQIEFDTHVAHSLKVVPKELPTVANKVANASYLPEKSYKSALEREIKKDIEAEHESDKLNAFNKRLPQREQWRAPRNGTEKVWGLARHVPRELVTFKTVWEGITNLRSVIEYCRWMTDNPQYRRAPYLVSLGMFDPAVLEARSQALKSFEFTSACNLQKKFTK